MKKAQKRRTISLLLSALCASCGFLAACGGGGRDSEYVYRGNNVMDNLGPSTGTISFMVYGGWEELQNWDNLIEDFESKNPGITVETVTIPDGDMLYTNLAGGRRRTSCSSEARNSASLLNRGRFNRCSRS